MTVDGSRTSRHLRDHASDSRPRAAPPRGNAGTPLRAQRGAGCPRRAHHPARGRRARAVLRMDDRFQCDDPLADLAAGAIRDPVLDRSGHHRAPARAGRPHAHVPDAPAPAGYHLPLRDPPERHAVVEDRGLHDVPAPRLQGSLHVPADGRHRDEQRPPARARRAHQRGNPQLHLARRRHSLRGRHRSRVHRQSLRDLRAGPAARAHVPRAWRPRPTHEPGRALHRGVRAARAGTSPDRLSTTRSPTATRGSSPSTRRTIPSTPPDTAISATRRATSTSGCSASCPTHAAIPASTGSSFSSITRHTAPPRASADTARTCRRAAP